MKDESTQVVDAQVQSEMALPENAFTELKPGEEYVPPMRPDKSYPEATGYSVSMGLVMAVIFSAAAAYLGLKVGQVFEAAIPIAIIAAGIAGVTKRKNSLGENVLIQSIGAASGIVVAGAIFTLPALYILQVKYPEITVNFLEVFLSSLLGGLLGILFFIPFRKYFVKEMHGKFPFPEATATTQVLISGQKGGDQAKPLLVAGLVGGLYDFFLSTFGWWKEVLTTQAIPALQAFTNNTKMMFSINTGSAVLGLGYIVGLRYAFIIFAGSAFIWWCVVPLLGSMVPAMADMAPGDIFKDYARPIGIGGIAMSGVIGIIKSWGVIKSAVGLAGKSFSGKGSEEKPVRTQKDISMKLLVFSLAAALVVTFVFFWIGVIGNLLQAIVAFFVVVVIAFLFTTVAANAIAIVGSNPVSGMTLMTLIGLEWHKRHHCIDGDWWRGVHCTLHGRRHGNGYENRILVGLNPSQTANMESCGHFSVGSHRGRRAFVAQQGLWLHRPQRDGGSASQCHGSGNRPADDGRRHSMDTLLCGRHFCLFAQLARRAGIGILIGYVHPVPPQFPTARGWCHQLVCGLSKQR